MATDHGSSTQLYTPPPLGCPPTRLSSSQTDVLKGKRSKEGLQRGSHTAFPESFQNDVTRSHLEAQTSKPPNFVYRSAKQRSANNQG